MIKFLFLSILLITLSLNSNTLSKVKQYNDADVVKPIVKQ